MRQRLAKRLVPDLLAVLLVSAFTAENGARSQAMRIFRSSQTDQDCEYRRSNRTMSFEADSTPAAHLPQSGNARLRFKNTSTMPDVIDCIFIGDRRPRTNQRHLAAQHVPKLGKLIKARFPQQSPKWRHPGIVCDLVTAASQMQFQRQLCRQ